MWRRIGRVGLRATGVGRCRYGAGMSSIYEIQMTGITGDLVDFEQFRGQVLVIVNVASA